VLLDDDYLVKKYAGRLPSVWRIALGYFARICIMREMKQYDVVWVEREALPWLPWWVERAWLGSGVRLVSDFDDAVWVRYSECKIAPLRWMLEGKIRGVMAASTAVVAGNDEIAGYAERSGAKRVVVIPTVVDIRRYLAEPVCGREPVVCWIGTPVTSVFLEVVRNAFTELAKTHRFVFRCIGAKAPNWPGVTTESVQWSEETEARELNRATVGIMPLSDGAFQRGKCGYKLIQYMASGLPVIASPVGVNTSIVRHGCNGYLASTSEEWHAALLGVLSEPRAAREMGRRGRQIAEREYSLGSGALRLATLIEDLVKDRHAATLLGRHDRDHSEPSPVTTQHHMDSEVAGESAPAAGERRVDGCCE
jgi:hypothetical protein